MMDELGSKEVQDIYTSAQTLVDYIGVCQGLDIGVIAAMPKMLQQNIVAILMHGTQMTGAKDIN